MVDESDEDSTASASIDGVVTTNATIGDAPLTDVFGQMVFAADVGDTTWRTAALDRGYRSAAAIPLTYRDTSYGVRSLYAPRANAFDGFCRTRRHALSDEPTDAMRIVSKQRT